MLRLEFWNTDCTDITDQHGFFLIINPFNPFNPCHPCAKNVGDKHDHHKNHDNLRSISIEDEALRLKYRTQIFMIVMIYRKYKCASLRILEHGLDGYNGSARIFFDH